MEKRIIVAAGFNEPGFESYRDAMLSTGLLLMMRSVPLAPYRPLPQGDVVLTDEEERAPIIAFTVDGPQYSFGEGGTRLDTEATIESLLVHERKVVIVTPLVAGLCGTHWLRIFRGFAHRLSQATQRKIEVAHTGAVVAAIEREAREAAVVNA